MFIILIQAVMFIIITHAIMFIMETWWCTAGKHAHNSGKTWTGPSKEEDKGSGAKSLKSLSLFWHLEIIFFCQHFKLAKGDSLSRVLMDPNLCRSSPGWTPRCQVLRMMMARLAGEMGGRERRLPMRRESRWGTVDANLTPSLARWSSCTTRRCPWTRRSVTVDPPPSPTWAAPSAWAALRRPPVWSASPPLSTGRVLLMFLSSLTPLSSQCGRGEARWWRLARRRSRPKWGCSNRGGQLPDGAPRLLGHRQDVAHLARHVLQVVSKVIWHTCSSPCPCPPARPTATWCAARGASRSSCSCSTSTPRTRPTRGRRDRCARAVQYFFFIFISTN